MPGWQFLTVTGVSLNSLQMPVNIALMYIRHVVASLVSCHVHLLIE